MRKGIRYLRFSYDKQSQHSIERQDMITGQWMNNNKVEIVDTFKDEGHSARTFDRPDIKQLFDFIKRNYRGIDYLVVSELTRFSREAGDAINMVKKIQREYNIRIVSASRGSIYDCLDHNSFFIMGLEFLLGNSENIKRQEDIKGGIYTAKAIKGKWISGGPAPYGYKKVRDGANYMRMVLDEEHAVIVKYIFDAYLANTPIYIIRTKAKELGFPRTSKCSIQEILMNPVYCGLQKTKAWKDQPGGLFPLKDHFSIVDADTWNKIQNRLKREDKSKISVEDALPLKGVLYCHCGKPLTGAPSRSRSGQYYYYYKCNVKSSHNNISAIKAHNQLLEGLSYLSIPNDLAKTIRDKTEYIFEEKLKENQKHLTNKTRDLGQIETQIKSLEEKWINNQISAETYQRWFSDLTDKRRVTGAQIEKLRKDHNQVYLLLQSNIDRLTNLRTIFTSATTLQKQELLRMMFDNRLSYKDGAYRTTYIMDIFKHNLLIVKHKKLIVFDGKIEKTGGVDCTGLLSNLFQDFLTLISAVRIA